MPPPRCLHSVPLRAIDSALPSRSPRHLSATCTRISSSSGQQQRYASASASGPAKGATTLRLKKKGRPEKTAKPPEPGERKAMRKRIVLSNTNALPVRDVKPLSAEFDVTASPEVRTLPVEHIDQLRAVEAFKPKQGWSFFQTPAVLLRKEVKALGAEMDGISGKTALTPDGPKGTETAAAKKTSRKLVVGEKGSGKSAYLLQAMALAFQRGWVVINFPEGRDLTNASNSFAPIQGSNPTQYSQPAYTAKLLQQTLAANKSVLEKTTLSEKPKLPFPVKDNLTLAGLLELGQNDPDRAWPVFQVFWRELTASKSSAKDDKKGVERPPVLMCLDNIAHIMVDSKYQVLNGAGKLAQVHSHDLALVQHFLSHLSGATPLPNGGIILAATSASDAPNSEAMKVGIAVAETRQNLAANPKAPAQTAYKTAYTEVQKLSPTRDADPTALSNFWSPYAPIDKRVLSIFTPPSLSSNLEIVRLTGLSQVEATTLMKYWTLSGMSRGAVLPWTVQEARALSGGAVVGQFELAAVRFLQREPVGVEDEPGGSKIRVH